MEGGGYSPFLKVGTHCQTTTTVLFRLSAPKFFFERPPICEGQRSLPFKIGHVFNLEFSPKVIQSLLQIFHNDNHVFEFSQNKIKLT